MPTVLQAHKSAAPLEDKEDSGEHAKRVSITEGAPPNTGHALLREGDTDCIALSRKGLFTTGKVLYNSKLHIIYSVHVWLS